MEPMLMVRTAAVLLAITALGGLAMAGVRFAGEKQPPAWLAMVLLPKGLVVGHAVVAVAGFVLLLVAAFG